MTGQPPQAPLKPEVRYRIASAARQIFANNGYDGASLRAIAQEAGVTKPMIYYYFGSKEALYTAVLADSFAELHRGIAEVARSNAATRDKLVTLVKLHMRHATQEEAGWRLMITACLSPRADARCEQLLPDLHGAFLRQITADGIASGEIGETDGEVLALLLRGIMTVFYEAVLHDLPIPGGDSLAERLIDAVWSGIGAKAHAGTE